MTKFKDLITMFKNGTKDNEFYIVQSRAITSLLVTEESFTSKASFLDEDPISTYQSGDKKLHIFSGKQINRGLYRSKRHILINADVNGAANILQKVTPKAFANGIAAACSSPQVVNVL